MSRLRRRILDAPSGRNRTPLSARGIRRMMMMALKMTALRMALCGVARRITLSGAIWGKVPRSIAGIMAKYFATSLAMLKVVSAPRVMRAIAVAIKVHAAHTRLGGKGDEFGMRQFMEFTPTQSELFLRENHNTAALGC